MLLRIYREIGKRIENQHGKHDFYGRTADVQERKQDSHAQIHARKAGQYGCNDADIKKR